MKRLATELSALLPTVNGASGVGAECAVIGSQRWPDLTVHLVGSTWGFSVGFPR